MVTLRDREILDGFGADPADLTIVYLFGCCSRLGLILLSSILLLHFSLSCRPGCILLQSSVISASSATSSRTSSASSSAVHPPSTWSAVLVVGPSLSRGSSSSRHYVFASYGSMDALSYEQSREGCKVVTDRSAFDVDDKHFGAGRTDCDNSALKDQTILSSFPRNTIRRHTNIRATCSLPFERCSTFSNNQIFEGCDSFKHCRTHYILMTLVWHCPLACGHRGQSVKRLNTIQK